MLVSLAGPAPDGLRTRKLLAVLMVIVVLFHGFHLPAEARIHRAGILLRIWPLYYLGVAIAFGIRFLPTHINQLTASEIAYLAFFVAWLGRDFRGNPMAPLWSISCEELFYAVWPAIAKCRGRHSILIAAIVLMPITVAAAAITRGDWYNPVVQFLFFAVGALLALALLSPMRVTLPVNSKP